MKQKSTSFEVLFLVRYDKKKSTSNPRCYFVGFIAEGSFLCDLQLVFEDLEVFLCLVDLLLILGTHQL